MLVLTCETLFMIQRRKEKLNLLLGVEHLRKIYKLACIDCDGGANGAEPKEILTEIEAVESNWYLAAIPKRVLLLPAVQARFTAVSRLSLTFW